MSASALLPIFLADLERDGVELAAASLAIRHFQFCSSQSAWRYNLDALEHYQSFWILLHRALPSRFKYAPDSRVLERMHELTVLSDAPPSPRDAPLIQAIRFAKREAEARWVGAGIHSRVSDEPLRRNGTNASIDLPSLMQIVRQAYRSIRGCYPKPFALAHYSIEQSEIRWSSDPHPGSFASFHGLSLTNVDLPDEFHLCAQKTHPDARYAYRVIELAHDIRGYAFEMLPNLARDPFRGVELLKHSGIVFHEWLLLMALCEFAAVANEWRVSKQRRAKERRRERGRMEGLREIARHNAERAALAGKWRAIASELAEQLRRQNPDRPLKSISEQVAEQIGRETDLGPLNPGTVNRFLRDEHPHLRKKSGSV